MAFGASGRSHPVDWHCPAAEIDAGLSQKWTAQASEVFDLLRRNKAALSEADIAALFKDPDQIRPHIRDILLSLDSRGCVETVDDGRGYIHAGPYGAFDRRASGPNQGSSRTFAVTA